MYKTYTFGIVYQENFRIDPKRKASTFIYPGQLYPGKNGLIPSMLIGAITQAPARPGKLMECQAVFKYFPAGSELSSLHSYLDANASKLTVVANSRGFFLMDKEVVHGLGCSC